MMISPNSDLFCLTQATRLLVRRPWPVLGLALLGMVLSALAPLVQVKAGLPDDPLVSFAVMGATLLPLELYFIPRFIMESDALCGGNPLNTVVDWKARFEERWFKAFIAKAVLGVLIGALAIFILPALICLLAFGWVPLRVLLKGESIPEAVKGSLRILATSWRRMVLAGSTLGLVYLILTLAIAIVVSLFVPEPSLRARMAHPALWIGNLLGNIVSLWLSAGFLFLFRRLDAPAA